MELPPIAQTPLQLCNQLRLADYPERALDEVHSACEFLNSLFAGRYRASGKSLIEHCVGTASILEMHGADAATVTAGLLHAVYSQGDFGDDILGISPPKRRLLANLVGPTIEKLIAEYTLQDWYGDGLKIFFSKNTDPTNVAGQIAFIRAANELEEYVDFGVLYSTKSRHHEHEYNKTLIAGAKTLGHTALAAQLKNAIKLCNETILTPLLKSAHGCSNSQGFRQFAITNGNDSAQIAARSWALDQLITGDSSGLDRPESVRFTPADDCLAVTNSDGNSISFYKCGSRLEPKIETMPYLTIKDAHLNYVHDADFSPCGTMLAAAAREDHSLSIFRESAFKHTFYGVQHRAVIKGSKTGLRFPASVSFDPRGRQFAVSNRQATGISIFSIPEVAGTSVLDIEPDQSISEEELLLFGMSAPHGLSFSPDGRFLVVLHKRFYKTKNSQGNNGISVFRTHPNSQLGINPVPIAMFKTRETCLHSIGFHPDNQYFATSAENNTINLYQWQPATEPRHMILQLNPIDIGNLGGEVKGVSFSKDGKLLLACTDDHKVLVYSDRTK